MAADIRKTLQNKLITDFTVLKHLNGTDDCFADVEKVYLDFPTALPAAEVLHLSTSRTVDGLSDDSMMVGFTLNVYEEIETSADQTDADRRSDRLADIESRVYDYLEQIPNPIERSVTDVFVYRIDVIGTNFIYSQSESGIKLIMTIDFNLVVQRQVQNL